MKFKHSELSEDFPWGPIVAVHKIGAYTIVEHHPEIFKNCSGTGKYDRSNTIFSVRLRAGSYAGANTLDRALLICIGHARKTSDAVRYAAQLLEIS